MICKTRECTPFRQQRELQKKHNSTRRKQPYQEVWHSKCITLHHDIGFEFNIVIFRLTLRMIWSDAMGQWHCVPPIQKRISHFWNLGTSRWYSILLLVLLVPDMDRTRVCGGKITRLHEITDRTIKLCSHLCFSFLLLGQQ